MIRQETLHRMPSSRKDLMEKEAAGILGNEEEKQDGHHRALRPQGQPNAGADQGRQEVEGFIEEVVRIDWEVADAIRRRKEEFYERHPYLEPECEKGDWERFWDGCGEWCREHKNGPYNAFQFTVTAVAAFSGGFLKGMEGWKQAEGGINSINSLDDLLTNPKKLSGISGEELYNYLVKNGYDVKPLSKGSLKGIPYKEGGGFKVNLGGDRILQYHPENLSHHQGAYFKISSGETGVIRIDMDGNFIN